MTGQHCKICNSLHIISFKSGNTELYQCSDCGISFLANIPESTQLDEYYTENYTLKKTEGGVEHEVRRFFRYPEQVKLIADLLKTKPAPAKLLDIGCDRGFFLDEARRYGYSVTGVEPSKAGRNYCSTIGIETCQNIGEIQELNDIITLWHTLEHVNEPLDFMKTIHRLLKPNGITAIRVPDYGSFKSKIFGKNWIWFQPENHYFHYTLHSLRTLLEKSGFSVEYITSQKPNDQLTKKANVLARAVFKKYFGHEISSRKKAGRLYEDFAGVELYVLARKK